MEALLLKPEEAARALSISRAHIYLMIASGEIPSVKIGKSRRISVSALQEWIARLAQAQR